MSVMRKPASNLIPLVERFWKKVEKTSSCWLWKGAAYSSGYGAVRVYTVPNGRYQARAHRVAWTLTHGPIPDGLRVLHRCDNPICVNPDHLWLGTDQDNIDDMVAKGRDLSGRKRGGAKRIGRKRSAEMRQRMSDSGIKSVAEGRHHRARTVEIDGIIYPTLQAAAVAHGKTHSGIIYWIRKGRARSCAKTQPQE